MCLLVEEPQIGYLTLERLIWKGEKRISIRFLYDSEAIIRLRKIDDCRWSNTMSCWHIPDNESSVFELSIALGKSHTILERKSKYEDILEHKLPEQIEDSIIKFRRHLVAHRYSNNTIENYVSAICVFFEISGIENPLDISFDHVNAFNEHFIIDRGKSASMQNIFLSALKLYFYLILSKPLEAEELRRPRREHRLPEIFSKQEIIRIIDSQRNIKHRTMLATVYSCGLRCGELLQLKITDIDSDRMLLHVYKAKGKKDRIIPLPKKLLAMLREYYKAYMPRYYVFEGEKSGGPYGEASLRQVFRNAAKRAGIKRKAKLHWLRHSYATHLLESGTDLRYIQEILGHTSSRTTEIYTHVSVRNIQMIRNPFDDLEN